MDLMGGKAMKKNGFLAIIAMAALSFAACNKEGLPQEGNNTDLPSDESTPVRVWHLADTPLPRGQHSHNRSVYDEVVADLRI